MLNTNFIYSHLRKYFLIILGFSFIDSFAQISVTGGTGLAATYTTFTRANGLFAALNANPQTGNNIVVTVTANITAPLATGEDGSTALNQNTWASLLIQPSGARTVQQSFSGALFSFNGADNVTIDGLNSGGNSLTIANVNGNNTIGISTIQFINDACNNTITRCNILGLAKSFATQAGGTIFFGTGTVTGNDNNTVSYCNIGAATAANQPTKGVSGFGSVTGDGIRNSNILITNNNIFDCFSAGRRSAGISINNGNDKWKITNNRIYHTDIRTFNTGAADIKCLGVAINTSIFPGSFTINGNVIGFANSNGTGLSQFTAGRNEVQGIMVENASSAEVTSIQGNIISGIELTTEQPNLDFYESAFIGISLGAQDGAEGMGLFEVGNITPNSIGSLDGSSTITINSSSRTSGTSPVIGIFSQSPSAINVSNNYIGSITVQGGGGTVGFYGIFISPATTGGIATIENNIIGGPSSTGGIKVLHDSVYFNYGIGIRFATPVVRGNTIQNFTSNAAGASGGSLFYQGIYVTGSANAVTIQNNTIHSIHNTCPTATPGSIYGIDLSMPAAANIISGNRVHSLSITSANTNCSLLGIVIRSGTNTIYNNMVSIGLDASGNSITTGFGIAGIRDVAGSTSNYYHNSVYIGGSNVTGSARTSAFFSDANLVTRIFKNNIFFNARSDASAGLGNYAIRVTTSANLSGLTSNNNILYVTGVNGMIGHASGVNRVTLADWQAATGQDAASIAADPLYVVAGGTAATVDLHVQGSSPANDLGTSLGITTDIDGDVRSALTPDAGADEFSAATVYSWVGGVSVQWTNPSNWSTNAVPVASSTVSVTSGNPYYPTITTTQPVGNITTAAPAIVTISGGTLQIYGNVTAGDNTFNAAMGSVEFSRPGTVQTVSGKWFTGKNVSSLINSNTSGISISSAAGDTLRVLHTIAFGNVTNSVITTGNNLTLVSSDTSTASVGKILASNSISGNVTVERYIPGHPRAWQFLSVPATGQTIKQAWQEGATAMAQNPRPGYGTQISGDYTDAVTVRGFDMISPYPALKTYNSSNDTWMGVSSTLIPIANSKGYMLFVRGDRSVTSVGMAATAVKLRTSGALNTPANPPAVASAAAGQFTSIGNPYASAIDFSKLDTTGGIQDMFYVWDPKLAGGYGLGRYQTFTRSGLTYSVTPGGGSYTGTNRDIQSGQAFFVSAFAKNGTISFSENAKTSASSLVTRPAEVINSLRINLDVILNSQPVLIDGVLFEFSPNYSRAVDHLDAPKLMNTGENLASLRNGYRLAVERWAEPAAGDTFHLNTEQLGQQQYSLLFQPENLYYPGLYAVLIDNYLQSEVNIPLTETLRYDFSVNSDPSSSTPGRFLLVLRNVSVVPVKFTEIRCRRESGNAVKVNWKTQGDAQLSGFELERSFDGISFTFLEALPASGEQWLDGNASDNFNYYRVKAREVSGSFTYSNITHAGPVVKQLSVYPNPVTTRKIYLVNGEGRVDIKLFDASGKIVLNDEKLIQDSPFEIKLPHLAPGNYEMVISNREKRSVFPITIL